MGVCEVGSHKGTGRPWGGTRAQATWPDPSGRGEAARVGCGRPSLKGGWRPAGRRRWLGHPSSAASPECRGSAPAPSGIPGARGEGSGGSARSQGRACSLRGGGGTPAPPTCGREARHTWGRRAGGRRDHIRSGAQESPSRPTPARARRSSQSSPGLRAPLSSRRHPSPRGRGGAPRGRGSLLKDPGGCPATSWGRRG